MRPVMAQLSPEERKDNFIEVVKGYTEEQARTELPAVWSAAATIIMNVSW